MGIGVRPSRCSSHPKHRVGGRKSYDHLLNDHLLTPDRAPAETFTMKSLENVIRDRNKWSNPVVATSGRNFFGCFEVAPTPRQLFTNLGQPVVSVDQRPFNPVGRTKAAYFVGGGGCAIASHGPPWQASGFGLEAPMAQPAAKVVQRPRGQSVANIVCCLAMVGHGGPWAAIAGHGGPWRVMVGHGGHGGPWRALAGMAGHGRPRRAMAGYCAQGI